MPSGILNTTITEKVFEKIPVRFAASLGISDDLFRGTCRIDRAVSETMARAIAYVEARLAGREVWVEPIKADVQQETTHHDITFVPLTAWDHVKESINECLTNAAWKVWVRCTSVRWLQWVGRGAMRVKVWLFRNVRYREILHATVTKRISGNVRHFHVCPHVGTGEGTHLAFLDWGGTPYEASAEELRILHELVNDVKRCIEWGFPIPNTLRMRIHEYETAKKQYAQMIPEAYASAMEQSFLREKA